MPMFPENSMSLKGREGTFPEIHCTMSRPISKNAMTTNKNRWGYQTTDINAMSSYGET